MTLLPIDIVIAVKRRLEVKALLHPSEHRMMRNHSVHLHVRNEVPPTIGMLTVVQEILSSHPDLRVGQKAVEGEDDGAFFFLSPIVSCRAGNRDA